jgi:hypothetical protein
VLGFNSEYYHLKADNIFIIFLLVLGFELRSSHLQALSHTSDPENTILKTPEAVIPIYL